MMQNLNFISTNIQVSNACLKTQWQYNRIGSFFPQEHLTKAYNIYSDKHYLQVSATSRSPKNLINNAMIFLFPPLFFLMEFEAI